MWTESLQLGHPPSEGFPIHHAGADEIRPNAAKAAGDTFDTDGLGHADDITGLGESL
jgi:hypothetical protein